MDHFLTMKDVKKQGNSLKFKKKMFAMLNKEKFVIKLPEERVKELINSGEGLPYDPGTGKQMKEWVIIPLDTLEKWIGYAQEAKIFVTTITKR
jgi:hypothetical protein